MSHQIITIDRLALYEQVWTEPIHRLCKRYFLSDRGLGKLCARHNIPVPPRGYWARVAYGQKPKRTLLPPLKAGQPHTIHFEKYLKHAPGEEPQSQPVPAEVLFERDPEHRVTVPEGLRLTHALIRQARRLLREAKPDERGMLLPPKGCLHIRVSRVAQKRALCIMQALLDAMNTRGWAVRVATEVDNFRPLVSRTFVTVLDEEIAFGLEERSKQVPHVLTAYEKDSIKRGYTPYHRPWDLVPSGTLFLQIFRRSWRDKEWNDRASRRLEDQLNDFLAGLVEKALEEKKDRERRAIEEQHRKEAEQRREEEEARQRREDEKIEQWDTWMNAWKRAQEVRAFVAAARKALAPIEPGSKIEGRLIWAEGYANRIDPLRQA